MPDKKKKALLKKSMERMGLLPKEAPDYTIKKGK
jgi:hypothetical protein